MKARWTGCRAPVAPPAGASPSIVVIVLRWAMTTSVMHDSTRRPSTCTVQAPHWPWSHPFLLPVRPAYSRSASSSVTRGSSWSARSRPLTRSVTGTVPGAAVPVALRVNGRDLRLTLEPRVTLLDALREYAGLTGSKKGCDHGQCGACTVHVDGRRVLSCLSLAVMQQGKAITTIEGLAATAGAGAELHPMQRAFITHDGYQCGYCTPGQVMSACAVVREPWGPGDDDVREAMSGNLCRCGAYPGIVAAVQEVRRAAGRSASAGDA